MCLLPVAALRGTAQQADEKGKIKKTEDDEAVEVISRRTDELLIFGSILRSLFSCLCFRL